MRKVILTAGITLDGYLARPDDSIEYLQMTKEGEKDLSALFASADTLLMGRKTYDVTLKLMGGTYQPPGPKKTDSYIFSRTLPSGERNGVIFTNQTPAAWLRKIRSRPGKHIVHMGGGELARAFLKADLIDELFIGFVPILLGDGIPLFPAGFPQRDFVLLKSKTYLKSQVILTYRRLRSRKNTKRKGK
jgi:dihydrofolate reductase